jgi:hypothetical protein
LSPRLALRALGHAGRERLSTAELGWVGEELAARHLSALHWRILARRLPTPFGEIDLVAAAHGELVCVEVKAARLAPLPRLRKGPTPRPAPKWRPGFRLDARTLERQRRAGRYLAPRLAGGRLQGGRVDLVEVLLRTASGAVELIHHRALRRAL